jgi:uncharacterized membrane protein
MGLLDFIWLGFIAKKLYYAEMGSLLRKKPNMTAALAFYAVYLVGVVAFVVFPAVEMNSWQYAAGFGALFGLVAYATYDLTNLATMKDFPLKIALIDMAWGIFITVATAKGAFWIVQALGV